MELKGAFTPLKLTENLLRFSVFLLLLATIGLFIRQLFLDGHWILFGVFVVVLVGCSVLIFTPKLFPFRWLALSLVLLFVMAVYPIGFTLYTSFTNYSDGNLLTRTQVIRLLEQQNFLPEQARSYPWVAYRSDRGQWALVIPGETGEFILLDTQGNVSSQEEELATISSLEQAPFSIGEFTRLSRVETIQRLSELEPLFFGDPQEPFRIQSLQEVAQLQQRYSYRPEQRMIFDNQRQIAFYEDSQRGLFVAEDGRNLRPGFQTPVGLRNYVRLFTNQAIRGPFLEIFLWTFAFAFLSTGFTFLFGMLLAITLESKEFPGKKVVRSILILPQALPGVIGILMWRGLLNPHTGVITQFLSQFSEHPPQWFADPWAARVAVLMINLWLGYPYMLLIASGALQSIPRELYEAAKVDGARIFDRFRKITFPLLLLSVGPVLIATFTMNINNFNVIYLFNNGGPPIANSATPAGHTDILISYTYRLAFEGLRGSDYGFAAAITVIIFLLLTLVTLINMRKTRLWEELSENH